MVSQHNAPDLDLIHELLTSAEAPVASLYFPFSLKEAEKSRIRLKNAAAAFEHAADEAQSDALLDAAQVVRDLTVDSLDLPHAEGMAVFAAGNTIRVVGLTHAPAERYEVGSRHYVRPLFASLEQSAPFDVLCVAMEHVALYRAAGGAFTEVELPFEVPRTIAEALGEHDADGTGQAHSAGTGGAIHHDQDEGAHSKDRIDQFLSELARVLDDQQLVGGAPLVLAGVAFVIDRFATRIPAHWEVAGRVPGSTSGLTDQALYRAAVRTLGDNKTSELAQSLADLNELSPDLQALGVESVVEAANLGKVDTAYYRPGHDVYGVLDPLHGAVLIRDADDPASVELIDHALVQVLQQGGNIQAVDGDMPAPWQDSVIVARLRY